MNAQPNRLEYFDVAILVAQIARLGNHTWVVVTRLGNQTTRTTTNRLGNQT